MFAGARRLETVAPLRAQLGIESTYLDVTDVASIAAAAAEISTLTGGTLDVLVNNAGLSVPRAALDLDIEGTVKYIFDVNVFGVMRTVQAFSPLLIEAQGTVVNIGSIAPIVTLVFGAAYNASKAALHAYADCLRIEMKPFGVHVLTIITGGVKSDIVRVGVEKLPEKSRYWPIHEFWLKRVQLSQTAPMDTETYAKSVVARVVRGTRKPWFWEGKFSWLAWIVNTFLRKGYSVSAGEEGVRERGLTQVGFSYGEYLWIDQAGWHCQGTEDKAKVDLSKSLFQFHVNSNYYAQWFIIKYFLTPQRKYAYMMVHIRY